MIDHAATRFNIGKQTIAYHQKWVYLSFKTKMAKIGEVFVAIFKNEIRSNLTPPPGSEIFCGPPYYRRVASIASMLYFGLT